MIVYDLKCRKGHVFEAWFRDSAAYTAQAKAGKVVCPSCGSKRVEKALMAPHISKGTRLGDADNAQAAEARRLLSDLQRKIEDNFDDVGTQFAEEARKIHYGEADQRNIYGQTSEEEAKALDDEGVEIQRIPWLPRTDS